MKFEHANHVFLQGKGHGKVKLRMKYMSLEAIYSQPRSATVVCHSVLLDCPLLEPPSSCLTWLYPAFALIQQAIVLFVYFVHIRQLA